MADNSTQIVTLEEAAAVIERWEDSDESEPERTQPATHGASGDGESSSHIGTRGFASRKSTALPEQRALDNKKLTKFEQQVWDSFKLEGALDQTRLLEECRVRAQKKDRGAAEILKILQEVHVLRRKERARWELLPDRPSWRDLQEVAPDPQARRASGPHLWALLIGNDAYPQVPLCGAVNDSRVWRSYLENFLNVPRSRITRLKNADRETMVTALYNLRDNDKIKKGDHILFVYSGHGSSYDAKTYSFEEDIHLRVGSIEALCPIDRGLPSPFPGRSRVPDISDRELGRILSEIHDRRKAEITVFLDCCFSGGGLREPRDDQPDDHCYRRLASLFNPEITTAMFLDADEHPRRGPSTISVRSPTWAIDMKKLYRPVLLAACQDTELAREENWHGLFTSAVMRVLRSEKGKGLTCSGLINAINPLAKDQKSRFDGNDRILF